MQDLCDSAGTLDDPLPNKHVHGQVFQSLSTLMQLILLYINQRCSFKAYFCKLNINGYDNDICTSN